MVVSSNPGLICRLRKAEGRERASSLTVKPRRTVCLTQCRALSFVTLYVSTSSVLFLIAFIGVKEVDLILDVWTGSFCLGCALSNLIPDSFRLRLESDPPSLKPSICTLHNHLPATQLPSPPHLILPFACSWDISSCVSGSEPSSPALTFLFRGSLRVTARVLILRSEDP